MSILYVYIFQYIISHHYESHRTMYVKSMSKWRSLQSEWNQLCVQLQEWMESEHVWQKR